MHLFVPDPQKFTNVEPNGGEISELVCINGRVVAQNLKSAAACEQASFFTDEDGWPPWMTSPADDPFDARAAAIPAPLTPSYPVMEFPQFVSKQSENSMRWRNFSHFWGLRKPPKLVAKTSVPEAIVSTVVESNETPFGREDPTHTSSPGRTPPASGANQNLKHHRPEKTRLPASETRIRKERDGEDADYLNEEGEAGGSESTKRFHRLCKRSRSAEVHNLAERKRRDRIKEKMKELQQLIPCSNNVDKASLLDDAIQYIKSLQLQLQMMSMVCGMVPMMYSGMQPCMPLCGMAMGMGMNQSIPPYTPTVPSLSRPCPAAAIHIGPMCQILHPFQLQQVSESDTSIIQAGNQTDRPPVLSISTADAYQQPCSGINTIAAPATAGNGTQA